MSSSSSLSSSTGPGGRSAPTWDPETEAASSSSRPAPAPLLLRLRRELRALLESPLPGIVVVPDDDNVLRLHALISGPSSTPYEHGFFYFLVQMTHDYPEMPPKVKLMTTGGGAVRFNPNLYADGKVCLSILGTWSGPGWSPALNLSAVLLSIQSLMSEEPLKNEPGWEKVTDQVRLKNYNNVIRHETLRIAVIDNVSRKESMHPSLREAMLPMFSAYRESYSETCNQFKRLDGGPFMDTLCGKNKGTFMYDAMRKKIDELADKVDSGELL